MSDDNSARLTLPYLAAGQMQKHVTLNEALTRLDALVQAAVVSRTTAEQPADPDDGDLHILPMDAHGAVWDGRPEGALMRFEAGGWTLVPAPDGMIVCVLDVGELVVRHDGGWRPLGELLGELQQLTRLGLGTTADADNPFAAKLNKALWTALETGSGGDGDLRLTLNKQGSGDVLSLLFQSGYGGRAELGLIGDDDLRLKVSADGSAWHEALSVDRATGRVTTTLGALRSEETILTADGSWTAPAWARRVEALCVGAGGGGAGGQFGASGTDRLGGGGGAGGVSLGVWSADALTGPLTVTVGAGGPGGSSNTSGQSGEASSLSMGAVTLLTGAGGQGGSTTGAGGAGGAGVPASNSGGASLLAATAQAGGAQAHPLASGGGAGGGALDAANTSRHGGAGGDGGLLAVTTGGGTGGSGAGGDGDAASDPSLGWTGGGGGGGGASVAGTGHPGGDGGDHGAGGGGGGAGLSAGGAGGDGASGVVILRAIG